MMINIKHILYATDNSKNARDAYEYASSIAHQYDAKLTLLHVIQDAFDLSVFDINMGRSSSERKWLESRNEYLEKRRQEITETVEAEYSSEGICADHIIIEEGIPASVILHMADEKKCDFIVMGMTGRGRTLEEAIMGDTVRRVLHRSKLPVLVVEPIEQKLKA